MRPTLSFIAFTLALIPASAVAQPAQNPPTQTEQTAQKDPAVQTNGQTAQTPDQNTDQAAPSGQAAQTPAAPAAQLFEAPDITKANFVDFGYRGTSYATGSDEARYQRYRDLRNGPTIDIFRYQSETDQHWFKAQADHVGYHDQRYFASWNEFGKVKASFEWNQIPLFYSNTTSTLYTVRNPGDLQIDNAIQSGIQNKTTTLPAVLGQAQTFDLKMQRDIADFKLSYNASKSVDLNFTFKSQMKNGNQPWAGTFGFSNADELPVTVDTRTTDVGGNLEWADNRGSIKLAYDGSFFTNNIPTLTWDNPWRSTDSTTLGPTQGRMSLWPDSSTNTGSVFGLLNLPGRSHATAYVSVGDWTQNAALIPFTSNGALLPVIPLDRPTANADAKVTALNFTFNSRPTDLLWFQLRYRSYDFNNETPAFHVTNTVSYDTSVSALNDSSSPYSFTRRAFDAETSFTPNRYSAFRVGYTRETVDQSFRTFDTTAENTLRLSADATGVSWLTLRAVYEYAKRTGTGLDEQSLDDIGEQSSLRQFDISDRTSNRFSAVIFVMPTSDLSFNATISTGNDDRPSTTPNGETTFGLLSQDVRVYEIGMDYVPRETVTFGLLYEHDKYDSSQLSRSANPGVQFNDPTRNWTTTDNDYSDTVVGTFDLIKAIRNTDIKFAYNYMKGQSTYIYGLPANTTLPPVQQLAPVLNQIQRFTADLRYYINRHWSAGGAWWYEKYTVNDFAQDATTLTSIALPQPTPTYLMIGYVLRPYTANTFWGRVTYLF